MLGEALLSQKQYPAAEPFLLDGYRGLEIAVQGAGPHSFDGPSPDQLKWARDRIVRLYDAWGKKDDADRWRAEKSKEPTTIEGGPMPRVKQSK
jgi:hypothetical protein